MTDTLRDRIAAVQAQHQPTIVSAHGLVECSCSPGWRLSTMTDHGLHVADAVISELGLRTESRKTWVDFDDGHAGGYPHPYRQTRYVTDWEADES